MKFQKFLTIVFIPGLHRSSRMASTISSYHTACRRFREWLGDANPKLKAIDKKTLIRFREHLVENHSVSIANKTINHIKAILNKAAELDYLKDAPKLRPIEEPKRADRRTLKFALREQLARHAELVNGGPITLEEFQEQVSIEQQDELSRLYESASRFTAWPNHNAADFWKGLVVILGTYGLRTCEAVKLTGSKISLKWSNVRFETSIPESPVEAKFGFLCYVPPKQLRFKPEPLALPLTETARLHLEALPRTSEYVFPCPMNKERFYRSWDAILDGANIAKTIRPKHLRKTASTRFDYFFPGLGETVTGHAERSVNGRHYNDKIFQLAEACQTLPQPFSWRSA